MSKAKLLVVEDDPNLGDILKEYLEMKGYEPTLCRDGEEGWNKFKKDKYDLCLLDIMMPKKDGFTLAKEIKKVQENLPILFLTAKNQKDDIIEGLKIGADDYLTKPFSMEELLLRITAILRRTQKSTEISALKTYTFGDFVLHYDEQFIEGPEGRHKLTSKENELIRLLASEINKLVNRSHALKQIWGDDSYFNARSMDVYLSKIRKILKDDPKVQIITIHGEGFKMIVGEG
ncbi:MAG: response regulator transcription factor [Algoriphagus sp.]|jgi:two-component system, OmpR family, response regulator VicR|uniref:response regulator transcription factor n=1 Tax=Algoriphagus sp. TaxID=1872435 RepID=UPI00271F9ECF|nr:response regulator transcription factor [Algoriphagus sp.]MDO8966611.1 response regulator transcription factor [Algoriphagus sp.]MDP2040231.1 response regulator transcription factor [Algoriphagus sp.]MDP3202057.1 response regulator transcription factor [Algoriphagus sp.]MDP3471379.1 response regulator transcription factor [Algoriphagus sp.]